MTLTPQVAWKPYCPSASHPWTAAQVGHLYRRAGFGATAKELRDGAAMGPDKLLDRLLEPQGDLAAFEAETQRWSESIRRTNNAPQASEWWLYRMLKTPFPLKEKLALFWHNHFATSNAKVLNAGYMLGQYDTLYKHALGHFDAMLQDVSKDPAMLVWLDTVQSKKGMPNENYARELMELFSLGIGNYTEADIREAARAFTGWGLRGGQYALAKDQFDDGEKAVFGKKGPFTGEGIVDLCLRKPACAKFIVQKLYRELVNEAVKPGDELLSPLVEMYRKDYNTGKLVGTILRSNQFFAPENYRAKVKSPVEFVCGIVRGLEGSIGVTNLARALEGLGQNLFNPPSVKGWDGGPAWLNGQTLLTRQNLSLQLCETRQKDDGKTDSQALAARFCEREGAKTPAEIVALFLGVFLQDDVPAATRARLAEFGGSSGKAFPAYWSEGRRREHETISLGHLILTLPEWQLN